MYHAASVPHLGQPTAEQSEYVYQPAPRQYSTYSTPVQHGYGPVYGYASTPTHFQQPATAYVPAVSAAHIYPIGGDYPMQLYAQTPAGLVPVYTQQPAYTLPTTTPVPPPPTPTQNFYHGEDQSGHNALAPVHRPTARTPPQQTSRNNISGPKQVGSPMCTSTPVRGAPPTPSSVRRASLSSQTPSAICFRKTGARVDVTKDNLISCIYPSDEELPISGRKKPQPVSLRRRDNTASSSELTMSRQAHNLSSPSFMVVQKGQWRGGHEWEDRGQSLKREDDWEQRRAGQQVRGRTGHESRLQSNPFKQPILVQNLKYKTKMCRNEEANGFCPYGVRCIFLHRAELDEINRTKKKDISGNGSKGSNSRHGDSGVGASTDEKVARGRGQWLAEVDGGQNSADGCLSRSTLHRFSSVQHLPRAIN